MYKPVQPLPLVPCVYCGRLTVMIHTQLCDGCWELRGRIRAAPELAQKFLDELKDHKNGD